MLKSLGGATLKHVLRKKRERVAREITLDDDVWSISTEYVYGYHVAPCCVLYPSNLGNLEQTIIDDFGTSLETIGPEDWIVLA